jgi:hypothetical protein
VDAQFADAVANRLNVACVPIGETIQAGGDQGSGSLIPELHPPFAECFGLLELEHRYLSFINYILSMKMSFQMQDSKSPTL